jgi:hypothetical protein
LGKVLAKEQGIAARVAEGKRRKVWPFLEKVLG